MQIINYYPPVVRQIKEIQRIATAEDREFSKLAAASASVLKNMFISTADGYGIARFEKLSGITPEPGMTLEERKMHVLAVANKCKMTLLELMFMLSAYPGSIKLLCDYNATEMFVDVGEDVTGTGVIYGILDSFLPLQVYIIFALEYETVTGFNETYKSLEMETTVRWWKAAWYLDGSVKLDGSRKLDAVLWEQKAALEMETMQNTMENFGIESLLYEMYTISRIKESQKSLIFETDIQTDTQENLQQEAGVILEIFTETYEEFIDVSLNAERNLWYLDGSVRLDGSRKLNAKKTREVL